MHQFQLIHSEDAVANQSSAVETKDLVAVQFQLDPKSSAGLRSVQLNTQL